RAVYVTEFFGDRVARSLVQLARRLSALINRHTGCGETCAEVAHVNKFGRDDEPARLVHEAPLVSDLNRRQAFVERMPRVVGIERRRRQALTVAVVIDHLQIRFDEHDAFAEAPRDIEGHVDTEAPRVVYEAGD